MSKIIELLEKARGVYSGYGSSERYVKLLLYLDQALTLLKQQPTETTETSIGNNVREIAKKDKLGVTGFVSDKVILNQAANRLDVWWKYIGELKEKVEQPTTGEFTKELRIMATQVPYLELGGFDLPKYAENLINAAKIIDTSEVENQKLKEQRKDLLEALEEIRKILQTKSEIHRPEPLVKPTWVCLEESHYRELEIRVIAAIAKVQKED